MNFLRVLRYIYVNLKFITTNRIPAITYTAITVLSWGIKHFDRANLSREMTLWKGNRNKGELFADSVAEDSRSTRWREIFVTGEDVKTSDRAAKRMRRMRRMENLSVPLAAPPLTNTFSFYRMPTKSSAMHPKTLVVLILAAASCSNRISSIKRQVPKKWWVQIMHTRPATFKVHSPPPPHGVCSRNNLRSVMNSYGIHEFSLFALFL